MAAVLCEDCDAWAEEGGCTVGIGAGIAEDRKGLLFRTSSGHNGNALSDQAMNQSAAWRMIRQRRPLPGSTRPLAIIRSERPGSLRTSRMAVRSSTPRKWRRTKAHERPSSMPDLRRREGLTPDHPLGFSLVAGSLGRLPTRPKQPGASKGRDNQPSRRLTY
jgi:hypothetical protein